MRFKSQLSFVILALITLIPLVECRAASSYDYNHLKRFSEVYDIVKKNYVREVSNDELIDGALKGMLQALDPHSSYLTPEEFSDMRETTSGEFSGIGVEISTENGKVTVVSPIDDTPAYNAGVKAGDAILAIDGRPTMDMSPQEVVNNIRGPKGSEVELLILHKDSNTPETLKVKRDAIPLMSVKARYLEDGYLWLRLSRFNEKTTDELVAAIKNARKQTAIKGVILDLRNNPGGLLEQSFSVADLFIQDGLIVSMKGRGPGRQRDYKANKNTTMVFEPVVVLVNSGSASAAEIVAGALQDRKRAVLIGERTFGKGSVQEVRSLDGFGIKLTTALYYTPSGRSIQAEGIQPDLEIPFEAPRDTPKIPSLRVREQDLSHHLANNTNNGDKGKSNFKPDPDAQDFLDRDNQLRMALQIVKSLPIIQELSWKQ